MNAMGVSSSSGIFMSAPSEGGDSTMPSEVGDSPALVYTGRWFTCRVPKISGANLGIPADAEKAVTLGAAIAIRDQIIVVSRYIQRFLKKIGVARKSGWGEKVMGVGTYCADFLFISSDGTST